MPNSTTRAPRDRETCTRNASKLRSMITGPYKNDSYSKSARRNSLIWIRIWLAIIASNFFCPIWESWFTKHFGRKLIAHIERIIRSVWNVHSHAARGASFIWHNETGLFTYTQWQKHLQVQFFVFLCFSFSWANWKAPALKLPWVTQNYWLWMSRKTLTYRA